MNIKINVLLILKGNIIYWFFSSCVLYCTRKEKSSGRHVNSPANFNFILMFFIRFSIILMIANCNVFIIILHELSLFTRLFCRTSSRTKFPNRKLIDCINKYTLIFFDLNINLNVIFPLNLPYLLEILKYYYF